MTSFVTVTLPPSVVAAQLVPLLVSTFPLLLLCNMVLSAEPRAQSALCACVKDFSLYCPLNCFSLRFDGVLGFDSFCKVCVSVKLRIQLMKVCESD